MPAGNRLHDRRIAIAEHRLERELTTLIEREGGTVFSCPLLEEAPLEGTPELEAFLRHSISPGFDFLVFFTGVGFRFLHEQAVRMGCGDEFLLALERSSIVARGPKPRSAMRRVGVRVDMLPAEATTAGLLELLGAVDVRGKSLGVQLYGVPNPAFSEPLRERGARLETVQVYEYREVSDPARVAAFIDRLCSGDVDAVTFTSAPQVRSLFSHADRLGRTDALVTAMSAGLIVVTVGGVTGKALEERGVTPALEPPVPKMGPMVESLAAYFGNRAR
jgi:uroporphyrinogen-III synthase